MEMEAYPQENGFIPGERIAEVESEDTDDTDSVEPYPDFPTIGDIGETSGISSSGPNIPSPLHTLKARKTKEERTFLYNGYWMV